MLRLSIKCLNSSNLRNLKAIAPVFICTTDNISHEDRTIEGIHREDGSSSIVGIYIRRIPLGIISGTSVRFAVYPVSIKIYR